jgi:hypothetical protein
MKKKSLNWSLLRCRAAAPIQNSKFKIQDWCVEVLAVRVAQPVLRGFF